MRAQQEARLRRAREAAARRDCVGVDGPREPVPRSPKPARAPASVSGRPPARDGARAKAPRTADEARPVLGDSNRQTAQSRTRGRLPSPTRPRHRWTAGAREHRRTPGAHAAAASGKAPRTGPARQVTAKVRAGSQATRGSPRTRRVAGGRTCAANQAGRRDAPCAVPAVPPRRTHAGTRWPEFRARRRQRARQSPTRGPRRAGAPPAGLPSRPEPLTRSP